MPVPDYTEFEIERAHWASEAAVFDAESSVMAEDDIRNQAVLDKSKPSKQILLEEQLPEITDDRELLRKVRLEQRRMRAETRVARREEGRLL